MICLMKNNFWLKHKKKLNNRLKVLKFLVTSARGQWVYALKIQKWMKKLKRIYYLKLIGWWTNIFLKKNGLRELGWCEKYLLDRRSVNYHTEQQAFKKTEIVEIYWFNSSPNRFDKKSSLTTVDLCKCMNCYFLWISFLGIKYGQCQINVLLIFSLLENSSTKGISLSGLEVYITTSYILVFLRTEWEKTIGIYMNGNV